MAADDGRMKEERVQQQVRSAAVLCCEVAAIDAVRCAQLTEMISAACLHLGASRWFIAGSITNSVVDNGYTTYHPTPLQGTRAPAPTACIPSTLLHLANCIQQVHDAQASTLARCWTRSRDISAAT